MVTLLSTKVGDDHQFLYEGIQLNRLAIGSQTTRTVWANSSKTVFPVTPPCVTPRAPSYQHRVDGRRTSH